MEQRQWILDQYLINCSLYLDETKSLFLIKYGVNISISYIWSILSNAGLTWKVIEQRAIEISIMDIYRFTTELTSFPWLLQNLVFVDEVSFDSRDMFRRRGYGIVGKRLVCTGKFRRTARMSYLCFVG